MSLVDQTRSVTGSRRLPPLLVFGALGGILLVYFALPFAVFLGRTGSVPIAETLSETASRTAIRNSLLTAPVATAIATILGVPLAYVLARETFPGKRLVEALIVLPLVVPPVVGGAMLLSVVGRFTPIGAAAASAGVPLTDSLVGVILAYNDGDNEIAVIPLETEYDKPNVFALQSGDPPQISARRFLKDNDITPEQTIRYSPEWDETLGGEAVNGGLRIDLDQDGEVVTMGAKADDSEDK